MEPLPHEQEPGPLPPAPAFEANTMRKAGGALRPLGSLPKVVQGLALTMAVISLGTSLFQAKLSVDLRAGWNGARVSDTTQSLYDASGYVGLVGVAGLLITAIATMMLLKRMVDNGAILSPALSKRAGHWAITGWLIPILNLWRPRQMVQQVWDTSRGPTIHGLSPAMPRVIDLWWGSFVLTLLAERVAPSAPWNNPTLLDLADEALGFAVTEFIQFISALLFFGAMRSLAKRHQDALSETMPTAGFQ